jgi:hypothetical protein
MFEAALPAGPPAKYIAERGEAIYAEKYRAELEVKSQGKFVAVHVTSGEVTLGDSGEEALRLALEKEPHGFFHLIRVGHQAAFEAGWYLSCAR